MTLKRFRKTRFKSITNNEFKKDIEKFNELPIDV